MSLQNSVQTEFQNISKLTQYLLFASIIRNQNLHYTQTVSVYKIEMSL